MRLNGAKIDDMMFVLPGGGGGGAYKQSILNTKLHLLCYYYHPPIARHFWPFTDWNYGAPYDDGGGDNFGGRGL